METAPSYEDLAETIARSVYYELGDPNPRKETRYHEGREWVVVNNMSSSGLQIPTGVLDRVGILERLDADGQRTRFSCPPEEFRGCITQNKSEGCSYDTLVLALICMLEKFPNDKAAYAMLERLGICEPDTDPPYDKGEDWPGESKIRWTGAKEKYDLLYRDWTSLLEN